MDLRMPRMDGITATRAVRALPRPPHVIALTTWDVDDAVLRSLDAGAEGFLLKSSSPAEIIAAVRAVVAGDAVLSPRSTRQVLDHYGRDENRRAREEAQTALAALTEREREIAVAVAEGLSNAEVAERLYVSPPTVKAHLATLQTKLGVRNPVQGAVHAERAGVLRGGGDRREAAPVARAAARRRAVRAPWPPGSEKGSAVTESRSHGHSSDAGVTLPQRLQARTRVAPPLQRRYRAGLAAGMALLLVGGVSAAAVVEEESATARADLTALGLEVTHPAEPGVTVPESAELELEELDVDVELGKSQVWHLRDAQVASRNAERREIAEREAAAAAEAREQSAPAGRQNRAPAAEEPAVEEQPAPAAASVGQGGERGSIASLVNNLRAQNGLAALGRDGTLDSVAQNWAEWMASNQVLQHNPNYASQIGGGWSRSGETIARKSGAQSWSSGDITSWMVNWWSNSAPHRANMLNTAYTHVGVGYAMGSGGPYAVLVFGGR